MEILLMIAIVLGTIAYLAVGFFIARQIAPISLDGLTWWQVVLVMLLWPFIPLLVLFAFLKSVAGGSN